MYGLSAYAETPYASLPVALDGVSLAAAQELPAFDQTATAAAIVALQSNVELPPFDQIATIGRIALIQAAQELPPFGQVAEIDLGPLIGRYMARIVSNNEFGVRFGISSQMAAATGGRSKVTIRC